MYNLSTKILFVEKTSWGKVLEKIREQVSTGNFRTWFAKTSANEPIEGKLLISVPSAFIKNHLSVKLRGVIEEVTRQIYQQDLNLEFKVDPFMLFPSIGKTIESDSELELEFSPPPKVIRNDLSGLNPKYTLENFMVGLSNNLAYAATQAVIQNPGTSYNPLFIYGGTGVGKTHLMHGVGNALIKKNPHLKIIYCSSEKFTNDFIQSIQTKKTGEFRSKYRDCGLLLIDDVQFIAGRDSTQEEFFHTFNELHSKNSQIILTSDRPPNEMEKLEARLMSRFQGGLMVDIQIPDFDTRVAILKAKCQERGELVSEECLTLIAESTQSNARELEGKLIQIIQTAKLTAQPLTIEFVSKYLGKPQMILQKVDYKRVLAEINQYFNVKMNDLVGPRRNKELVLPRQLAMYLLYEECKIPYERVGEILGGRDHTTILHGVGKIREAISRDREVQRLLIEIKQLLI